MTSPLLPSFAAVYDVLFNFAQSDGFWANLETAFGTSYDVVKATELRQQWGSRNFSQLPSIEVLSDEVLGTANGAYSSSKNKIYLSASFLNTASSASIINVILEEIGHYVDAQINQVDSAGDEGAIFAELVQGDALSDSQLALLRAENDWATMIIDGQLTAIEQSNPAPILVASYQGLRNARDVRVIGNYAYLADWSLSTADFKIINISTPTAPAFVSQSNATDIISDVDFLNGYVYAADGTSGLRVIDVSNPSSPSLKSTYNSPGDAQDVKIVGNYAYVADGKSGLQIVNISNPNSPVIQGNAPAPDDVTGVKGTVSGVDIVGNYAYIISYLRQSGFGELQIFNISNPNSPVKLGESTFSISTQDILYSVQVAGNYAYVAAGSRGLKIIDISNPISPTLKGEYFGSSSASAEDVQVVGNYAYVAYGVAGLDIIDISNPSSPILAASYAPVTEAYGSFGIVQKVTNYVTSVEVVNNYAYLTVQAAKDLGGLWILDVNQFTGTNQPPSITLAVSPSSVTEDGTTNLVYTFTRSGSTTNALTVNYTLGGTATLNTDYTRTGTNNTVTFAANSSTATITVDPTADTTVEPDETVTLTLAAGTGYTIGTTTPVTGTIKNDDVTLPNITLAVSPSSVTEDGTTNLVYTFTRSGSTTNALTVNYTLGGTATLNTDYTRTGTTNTVTFAAGSSTATVTVDPTADTTVESDETVILTLASGTGYTIGTTTPVTGTIKNDDVTLPSITLAVSPSSVTEDGTTNLVYTFTRTGSTTSALTANYTVGGTATLNTDYTRTGTNNTVTFAANSSTATITVDPTADTTVEPDETVTLTLAAGIGYTIGTTTAVTGTINNDDVSQLSINNITVVEGQDSNAILTVTVNNPNPQPISVNYTTAPINATANVDYTSKTGTLTIAANTSTATISIPILNDNLNEANETFAINLSNPVNATLTNNQGIVTISDTLTANVTTTLPANVENLTLNGTANINGTGNTLNNIITGNSGNNILNGATGIDTLIGGLGNDTYQVDTTTDTITENANQGTDTVESSVTYTLGNNLENLTLTGTTNINGTGNTLNNIITGNSGNNILNGSDGNDTLIGGTGNDTLTGGAGGDQFTFNNRNEGIDTITDFLSSQGDKIAVSAAGFGGGLAAGVAITAAQFVLGTTALNASNRFIYNTITGGLFFDGDGTGTLAAIQIATLSSKPTLTASDILVLV